MSQLSAGGHLMLRAVADTHAVIWYLFADERLSATARTMIEEAAAGGDQIVFSSITLKTCHDPTPPDQRSLSTALPVGFRSR
jgi:hypothetical protein